MPDIALTVTEPFGSYVRGDRITEAAEIDAALADNPSRVVRTSVPPAPAPAEPTQES